GEEEESGEEASPESGKEKSCPQERPPLAAYAIRENDGGSPALLPASAISLTLLFFSGHDCFRFDFHEHFWRNQGRDRHHGARGTNVAEKLAVRFSHFFPIRNVGKEHAGANHIFQGSSGPLQRAFNVLEGLNRLRVGIARADDFAVGSSRGCARNVNVCANSNRTRVTDNRLPWRPT